MNRILLHLIISFLFISVSSGILFSQNNNYLEVKSLFPVDESLWMNYYKGFDNLGNRYLLILANNQNIEKGFLYLLDTNLKYTLEGNYVEHNPKFLVSDSLSNIWGKMEGKRTDSLFQLKLISANKKQAFQLNLKQTNRNQLQIADCPLNISYQSYGDDSSKSLLNLQFFEDGIVHGIYYSQGDSTTRIIKGECKDLSCNYIQAQSVTFDTWKKEKLEIQLQDNSSAEIKFTSTNITKKFSAKQSYDFLCKSYLNKIHTRFLNIENRYYQKWAQDFTSNWTNACINKNLGPIDSARSLQLNMELAWCNKQFISAYLSWEEPGYKLNIIYPFNYNLKNGQTIQLVELFEKNTNYKNFIKNYIDSSKQILSKGLKPSISEFIKKDPFNYWTLLPSGICFASENNSIYGSYRILVPYSKLDAILRKNSFIKKLI